MSKFEKKCDEGFLLGNSTTSKAYRVWNLVNAMKNMDIGELRPREVIDIEDDKN